MAQTLLSPRPAPTNSIVDQRLDACISQVSASAQYHCQLSTTTDVQRTINDHTTKIKKLDCAIANLNGIIALAQKSKDKTLKRSTILEDTLKEKIFQLSNDFIDRQQNTEKDVQDKTGSWRE